MANRIQSNATASSENPTATLEVVDIRSQLEVRPRRVSNAADEHRALTLLAGELAANPRNVLQRLVEVAVELCGAHTAGISLLDGDVFRWEAVAGVFADARGGTMPRNQSPCGVCIDREATQLMHLADRCFPALAANPRFVEAMLIPFYEHGAPIGTMWIVSHTDDRKFDKEDERIVSELCKFASAGWQLLRNAELLEARVRERTAELTQSNAALAGELRERRAAQEQIKALLTQMVTIQEEERRRMARDIHDHLGQQMTALRLQLEALRSKTGAQPALAGPVGKAGQLSEELDKSIDFLTWQLRPAALEHLGLADALDELVSGWSERFQIAADFDAPAVSGLRLPLDVETNLYRVAQEALHNVYKHAGASRVNVCFEHSDRVALLVIKDEGRGFDPAGVTRGDTGSGLGLVSMRERAALAGGELQIESAIGRGTTVRVRIPVPAGGR